MSDIVKTSELSAKALLNVLTDFFVILDTADTTQAGTGSTKRAPASAIQNIVYGVSANLLSTVISNSALWNSAYTTLQSNSALYNSTYTTVNTRSAFWDSAYTSFNSQSALNTSVYSTVNTNSALWASVYASFNSLSANYSSVYSTVNTNSANWNSVFTNVNGLSADWNNISNVVKTNSAIWALSGGSGSETDPVFTTWALSNSAKYESTYNTVLSNSASWVGGGNVAVDTLVQNASANWNSVFTTTSSNSANWNNVSTVVQTNSSLWALNTGNSAVNTVVQTSSANWNSVFTTVLSNSASWIDSPSTSLTANANIAVQYGIAASDPSTGITVGTNKETFRMPADMTLKEVYISVTTPPSGSSIIVDVNRNGTTVFTTTANVAIAAGSEYGSTTALAITGLSKNDEISVDFDQVGSLTPGTGLKAWLIGEYVVNFSQPFEMGAALSDAKTTDITAVTGIDEIEAPVAFTLTEVRIFTNTLYGPSGSSIIVDVNTNGTSVFTSSATQPTISSGTYQGNSTSISDSKKNISKGTIFSFDIDQVGSVTAGRGLKASIIGYRN